MNYKATALILNGPTFKARKVLPDSCFGDFFGFISQTKWKIISSHPVIAQHSLNTDTTSKCCQLCR